MIKHIVLYSFTDRAKEEGVNKVFDNIKASVKSMTEEVPELLNAELVKTSGGNHDILYYCETENEEAMRKYLESEAHKRHADMARGYVADKESADIITD